MKNLILLFSLIICLNTNAISQSWVQTGSIPDGSGITEIVVTPQNTLLVTTASWGSLGGTLGGVRRSTN